MSRSNQDIDPFAHLATARRYLEEGMFLIAMGCLDELDEWIRTNPGHIYGENIRLQVFELDRRANAMKDAALASMFPRGKVPAPAGR